MGQPLKYKDLSTTNVHSIETKKEREIMYCSMAKINTMAHLYTNACLRGALIVVGIVKMEVGC